MIVSLYDFWHKYFNGLFSSSWNLLPSDSWSALSSLVDALLTKIKKQTNECEDFLVRSVSTWVNISNCLAKALMNVVLADKVSTKREAARLLGGI